MSAAKACVFLWTFASFGFVLTGANPCSVNPCQHGGLCVVKGNSFVCHCRRSYTGPTCQEEINPCRYHPCKNGGTCYAINVGGRGLFTCQCRRGYTGKRCENGVTGGKKTYKAAVFDFQPNYMEDTSQVLTRKEAIKHLTVSALNIFERQCRKARRKGVDIIVFPEYGLAPGLLVVRDVMFPFLETIPDPQKVKWNPCLQPKKYPDTDFQRRLSCMARKHKLYLVANMGSVEPCSVAVDTDCPNDSRYQYNTNVAFDPRGLLVARYRKHHTFYLERITYDTAKMVDYAAFKTPFGNFGTFICFDILFQEPTISLIDKWNLDSIAFPTAWVNVLPFFSATPFHGSFSTGKSINFLASNIHVPSIKATGSGIYTPGKTHVYRNLMVKSGSKLLISTVDIKPKQITYRKVTFPRNMKTETVFSSKIFGDMYNFAELPGKRGVAAVCHGDLCCRVGYRYKTKATDEYYALGAFDGLHTMEGTYYIQMCLLVKCGNMSRSSCGAELTEAKTRFSFLSITGNFSTPYVYPSMVTAGVNPSEGEYKYDGQSMVSHGTKRGLLSATFLARKYNLDAKIMAKRSNRYLAFDVERALADPAAFQQGFLSVV